MSLAELDELAVRAIGVVLLLRAAFAAGLGLGALIDWVADWRRR